VAFPYPYDDHYFNLKWRFAVYVFISKENVVLSCESCHPGDNREKSRKKFCSVKERSSWRRQQLCVIDFVTDRTFAVVQRAFTRENPQITFDYLCLQIVWCFLNMAVGFVAVAVDEFDDLVGFQGLEIGE